MPVPTINVLKCGECGKTAEPLAEAWFLTRIDNGIFQYAYYSERLMPDFDEAIDGGCLITRVQKERDRLIQAHSAGRTK